MKGLPPTPRDSHTCVTLGNDLYVFGGTDGSSPLKDLHVLDTGLSSPSSGSVTCIVGHILHAGQIMHEFIIFGHMLSCDWLDHNMMWKLKLGRGVPI